MHRTLITLALLGVSTVAASSVQAQSVPLSGNGVATSTMSYTAMPQVARDPKGIVSTWTPSADVLVAVDRSGHISEMRQNGQNLN
jgi:hypothetical protein